MKNISKIGLAASSILLLGALASCSATTVNLKAKYQTIDNGVESFDAFFYDSGRLGVKSGTTLVFSLDCNEITDTALGSNTLRVEFRDAGGYNPTGEGVFLKGNTMLSSIKDETAGTYYEFDGDHTWYLYNIDYTETYKFKYILADDMDNYILIGKLYILE